MLRYGNIDAITATLPVPKQSWFRGRTVPLINRGMNYLVHVAVPDRKLKIHGIYTLGKAGEHSINPSRHTDGYYRTSMQPVLITFDPPAGEARSVIGSGVEEALTLAIDEKNYGLQGVLLPSRVDYLRFISAHSPSADGFAPNSRWTKALGQGRILKGMTMEMVRWVYGQPGAIWKIDGGETWEYELGAPGSSVRFVDGKVVEEIVGRLP